MIAFLVKMKSLKKHFVRIPLVGSVCMTKCTPMLKINVSMDLYRVTEPTLPMIWSRDNISCIEIRCKLTIIKKQKSLSLLFFKLFMHSLTSSNGNNTAFIVSILLSFIVSAYEQALHFSCVGWNFLNISKRFFFHTNIRLCLQAEVSSYMTSPWCNVTIVPIY